jgi:hypothetical protein
MKIFLIEDFFHLPPVSFTQVVHLDLRISTRIFEKNVNVSYSIIRGLGETNPFRKPEVEKKSHGTVPLNHAAFALEDRIFLKPFFLVPY